MKFSQNWYADKAVKGSLAVVGGMVAAPVVMAGIGFTAGGVAAGSFAAAVQSGIGCVAAGSACKH